jgi:hypothetical protein
MPSVKQFEANRRNSLKSTGPKTEAGKRASRCNAVRHGLSAETETAVERELALLAARFLLLNRADGGAFDRLNR